MNLNQDNVFKLTTLMQQKIRKLVDKEIDCSDPTSFVERTRNAFLVHSEGISFYFSSEKGEDGDDGRVYYVPILLTWGELKGVRRF